MGDADQALEDENFDVDLRIRRWIPASAAVLGILPLGGAEFAIWSLVPDYEWRWFLVVPSAVLVGVTSALLLRVAVRHFCGRIEVTPFGIRIKPLWCGHSWEWFDISQWYVESPAQNGRVVCIGISGGGTHLFSEHDLPPRGTERLIRALEHFAARKKRSFDL